MFTAISLNNAIKAKVFSLGRFKYFTYAIEAIRRPDSRYNGGLPPADIFRRGRIAGSCLTGKYDLGKGV